MKLKFYKVIWLYNDGKAYEVISLREFVKGTNEQFDNLKKMLEDDMCHVYKNCKLPSCCNKQVCRIAFEINSGAYTVLIDQGITCSRRTGGIVLEQFKQWLAAGELIFLDFNDLKSFFKSLSILY